MRPIWIGAVIVVVLLGAGLFALSCKHNPAGTGMPAGKTINIVADAGPGAFGAKPETVLVNQTVSWSNGRGITHTSTATGGSWNTGNIPAGTTSTPIKMTTVGTFPYHCNIHGSMTGTLEVK